MTSDASGEMGGISLVQLNRAPGGVVRLHTAILRVLRQTSNPRLALLGILAEIVSTSSSLCTCRMSKCRGKTGREIADLGQVILQ